MQLHVDEIATSSPGAHAILIRSGGLAALENHVNRASQLGS